MARLIMVEKSCRRTAKSGGSNFHKREYRGLRKLRMKGWKHLLHQSTSPHYRLPFYNAVERPGPPDWNFKVVFDPKEFLSPIFFREKLQPADIHFPIQEVNTIRFPLFGKSVCYQTFWRQLSGLDLVILENAVNNLTYPLSHLHKLNGTRIVYWGHGQHRAIEEESRWKSLSERLKYL